MLVAFASAKACARWWWEGEGGRGRKGWEVKERGPLVAASGSVSVLKKGLNEMKLMLRRKRRRAELITAQLLLLIPSRGVGICLVPILCDTLSFCVSNTIFDLFRCFLFCTGFYFSKSSIIDHCAYSGLHGCCSAAAAAAAEYCVQAPGGVSEELSRRESSQILINSGSGAKRRCVVRGQCVSF
jgi:hypothetical protein